MDIIDYVVDFVYKVHGEVRAWYILEMRLGSKGLGGIIRQMRVNFGLTHHAAARAASMDQGHYSRIEGANSQTVTLGIANKVLMGLGYELHILPIGAKSEELPIVTTVTIAGQLYQVTYTPIDDKKG